MARPRNRVTIICQRCNKSFEVGAYRKDIAKFCSNECRDPLYTQNCLYCANALSHITLTHETVLLL